MTEHPIDHIEWVDATSLDANSWNPNRVHKMELRLLERSVLTTGWLQPILVSRESLIIDGFHRWRLAQDSTAIKARDGGKVPIARLDVDRGEAMLLTIRINRAKGTHVAVDMARIVHELLGELGYSTEDVMREMGATRQEVDLLAQDGVFSAANTSEHAYSRAWYPQAVAEDVPEPELPDEPEVADAV